MRRRLLASVIAALGAVVVSGVAVFGGAAGATAPAAAAAAKPAPGAREIDVSAESFEFDPDRIEVAAGENVAINLTSEDVFHDFVVQLSKKKTKEIVAVKGGKSKAGGLVLTKAGTYAFYCSVPGHRAAGMEGKIVVAPGAAPASPSTTTTTTAPSR
jgi:uncharacterized cupredoxin-like copper-binding protein